jgi:hypothetical protein
MSEEDKKARRARAKGLRREIEEAVRPGKRRSPRSPREFVEERMREIGTRRGKKPDESGKGRRQP